MKYITTNCLSTQHKKYNEDSRKIQHKFNSLKHQLANTQTHKWVLAPIMKIIMKNSKFSFNPPEWEKFNYNEEETVLYLSEINWL